jgi:hypothetical protein
MEQNIPVSVPNYYYAPTIIAGIGNLNGLIPVTFSEFWLAVVILLAVGSLASAYAGKPSIRVILSRAQS